MFPPCRRNFSSNHMDERDKVIKTQRMYHKIKKMPIYERVTTQSAVMKKNFMVLHQGINYWSLLIPMVVTSVL